MLQLQSASGMTGWCVEKDLIFFYILDTCHLQVLWCITIFLYLNCNALRHFCIAFELLSPKQPLSILKIYKYSLAQLIMHPVGGLGC